MIVTIGRSVGSVEVPASTRHIDWRVGDPTGASVGEARRVRDDIDRRVQELLPSSIHLQRTPARIVSARASESRAFYRQKPPLLRGFSSSRDTRLAWR